MSTEAKVLKDGRSFWTTNNGFTYWASDKKGKVLGVTPEYYAKILAIWRKENRKMLKYKKK